MVLVYRLYFTVVCAESTRYTSVPEKRALRVIVAVSRAQKRYTVRQVLTGKQGLCIYFISCRIKHNIFISGD
jgi:hypothetical protein